MRYECTLTGISPIIMHNGAAGLDVRSPAKLEIASITAKKGSNRTIADDQRLVELECQTSLYLTDEGRPTIPPSAIRGCIENGAKKGRQGGNVREGLIVEEIVAFNYDESRYGTTVARITRSAAFTVPVVVQRSRLLRTRAKFDTPWSVICIIDADDELVDTKKLEGWLDVAGRRVGLGDWRPACSGAYGRFTPEVKEISG